MTTKAEGDASASVDQNQDVNAANSSGAEAGHQEANTSTDANAAAGASSDAGKDGRSPAESSSAEGDKEPKSLLDAVTQATEKEKSAEKSPGSEGGSEKDKSKSEDDTDESEEDGTGELNEKELAALKPKTRKRMEYLAGQVGNLRPKADAMDQLVSYVNDAGLSTDEVNKGFEIMKLMKSDPFGALEQLRPYVVQLQQLTGATLPADLQQQVNEGLISEQHARTLVQTHTRQQLAQMAADRATQAADTLRTTHEHSTAVTEVASAVSDWERKWAASDPDYKAKQGRVQKDIHFGLLQMRDNRVPITREAVLKLANDCRDAVNAELKAYLPQKRQVDPLPNGQGSAKATAQPKTMLDAMNLALNGS